VQWGKGSGLKRSSRVIVERYRGRGTPIPTGV